MLEQIKQAIRLRQELFFMYEGFQRTVQPATFGLSLQGNPVLRCYQVAGGHVAQGHDWDLCLLSKISGLRTTGNAFAQNPPGYKRGDKGMMEIYAEL